MGGAEVSAVSLLALAGVGYLIWMTPAEQSWLSRTADPWWAPRGLGLAILPGRGQQWITWTGTF